MKKPLLWTFFAYSHYYKKPNRWISFPRSRPGSRFIPRPKSKIVIGSSIFNFSGLICERRSHSARHLDLNLDLDLDLDLESRSRISTSAALKVFDSYPKVSLLVLVRGFLTMNVFIVCALR